jgi:hypothetical protein
VPYNLVNENSEIRLTGLKLIEGVNDPSIINFLIVVDVFNFDSLVRGALDKLFIFAEQLLEQKSFW